MAFSSRLHQRHRLAAAQRGATEVSESFESISDRYYDANLEHSVVNGVTTLAYAPVRQASSFARRFRCKMHRNFRFHSDNATFTQISGCKCRSIYRRTHAARCIHITTLNEFLISFVSMVSKHVLCFYRKPLSKASNPMQASQKIPQRT